MLFIRTLSRSDDGKLISGDGREKGRNALLFSPLAFPIATEEQEAEFENRNRDVTGQKAPERMFEQGVKNRVVVVVVIAATVYNLVPSLSRTQKSLFDWQIH